MKNNTTRRSERHRRHQSIRKKIHGTVERPRLSVFRSHQHIYAQVINDDDGHTLVAASTLEKDNRSQGKFMGNVDGARLVGEIIARRAVEKGVKQVVFDRGGNRYHGRVAALAEAARENGLEF